MLESRQLFASLPFGATPNDTGEFMLGRIAVTPVLLESTGQFNPNTENWTAAQRATVESNIRTGLSWWTQLLGTKSNLHTLNFVIDDTYLTTPAPTPYEPISLTSNGYVDWVSKFLVDAGYSQDSQLEANMRAFNQAQREKYAADWSFTIFVVNSENDADGNFATGGSFDRAFAFAGGLFQIVPSTRPASTYTHETGHMFWARDEYTGGGNFTQRRGYYNTQNTNATDLNPNPNFVQADSIMSSAGFLDRAYQNLTSPASTLAQIGWQDSDNDGIFDVLDVPLKLEGTGVLNTSTNEYEFKGSATVQTLPNRNSSGLQNDITLNKVGRIDYRINQGAWQTLLTPNQPVVALDIKIPVPSGTTGRIEIRASESSLPLMSNIFEGTLGNTRDTTNVPGVQGFVWNDTNKDGQWQFTESPVAGARVRLVNGIRQPIVLQQSIEPDSLASGPITSPINGVTLLTIGEDTSGGLGAFEDNNASTGSKVFRPYSAALASYTDGFRGNEQQLRANIAQATSFASIDVIAIANGTIARLEAFSASGELLKRFETPSLNANQSFTMSVSSETSNIAYVIARGTRNAKVKLDNFRFGPAAEATTKADGSYVLTGLPAGNYSAEVVLPNSNFELVSPLNGLRSIAVTSGQILSHQDFSVSNTASPWQNQLNRYDVNNDNVVNALDVLVVINEINLNGIRVLTGTSLVAPPFYDVSGDRSIEALDALIVINFINDSLSSGGEGELGTETDLVDQAMFAYLLDLDEDNDNGFA